MNTNLNIIEKLQIDWNLEELLPKTAVDLYKAIESKGFQAFLVGGLPRFFAMEHLVKTEGLDISLDSKKELSDLDVDFSTNATYEEIQEIVNELGLKGTTGGKEFLVFHVEGYQVATYRKEISYIGDGIPVREKGSLMEDCSTRDFSMNSLYMSLYGEIYDFVGGIEDIRNKTLRSIGNAFDRLNEDSSRAIRVFDFATRYGLNIDGDLLKAVKSDEIKAKAKSMPSSMKGKMLKKFVKHGSLSAVFRLFEKEGMLDTFFPEFTHLVDAYQNPEYHHLDCFNHVMKTVEAAELAAPQDELLQLTMLWHDIAKNTELRTFKNDDPTKPQDLDHEEVGSQIALKAMKNYQFGREFAKEVEFLIRWHGVRFGGTKIKVKTAIRFLRKFALETSNKSALKVRLENLLKVLEYDSEGFAPEFAIKNKEDIQKMGELFTLAIDSTILFKEELPVTAKDLIRWGFPAGPALGEFLNLLILDGSETIERVQKLASNRYPNLQFD